MPPGADRPLAMSLVRCKMYIYVKRIAIIAMTLFLACKSCKHAFCFRILRIDVILQKTLYAMNLYNFQENLFLFSRNFTIWIGLQLASQSDSFQALGSCFCEKYSHENFSFCAQNIQISLVNHSTICLKSAIIIIIN